MQADGTDHYSITYELYNVLTKQRLLGFQVSSNRPGLRSAGHQIADAVFEKILGIRGAFSTRIAYISVLGHLPNKTFQLIVADADGENPRVVMQSHEPLMSPSWSPDGSSLAYVSFEARLPTVYVQTLKSRRPARRLIACRRESGAGLVAGRQEAGPRALHARRQLGHLCIGPDDPAVVANHG